MPQAIPPNRMQPGFHRIEGRMGGTDVRQSASSTADLFSANSPSTSRNVSNPREKGEEKNASAPRNEASDHDCGNRCGDVHAPWSVFGSRGRAPEGDHGQNYIRRDADEAQVDHG